MVYSLSVSGGLGVSVGALGCLVLCCQSCGSNFGCAGVLWVGCITFIWVWRVCPYGTNLILQAG